MSWGRFINTKARRLKERQGVRFQARFRGLLRAFSPLNLRVNSTATAQKHVARVDLVGRAWKAFQDRSHAKTPSENKARENNLTALASAVLLRALGVLHTAGGLNLEPSSTSANPSYSTRRPALDRVEIDRQFRVRRDPPLNSRAQRAQWFGVDRHTEQQKSMPGHPWVTRHAGLSEADQPRSVARQTGSSRDES